MGWDAYAEPLKAQWGLETEGDPEFAPAVEAARKDRFDSRNPIIDGLLRQGALDCSACASMMEKATGRSCWSDPWSPEIVKALAASARWDFPIADHDVWAMRSAKAFLERCAELGRGIRFSW